jgi:hypothetical protein
MAADELDERDLGTEIKGNDQSERVVSEKAFCTSFVDFQSAALLITWYQCSNEALAFGFRSQNTTRRFFAITRMASCSMFPSWEQASLKDRANGESFRVDGEHRLSFLAQTTAGARSSAANPKRRRLRQHRHYGRRLQGPVAVEVGYKETAFASAPSASSASGAQTIGRDKSGDITSRAGCGGRCRDTEAMVADDADGADGILLNCTYPNDPASTPAFPTEDNVDAQYPQERLRPAEAASERAGIFGPVGTAVTGAGLQNVGGATCPGAALGHDFPHASGGPGRHRLGTRSQHGSAVGSPRCPASGGK